MIYNDVYSTASCIVPGGSSVSARNMLHCVSLCRVTSIDIIRVEVGAVAGYIKESPYGNLYYTALIMIH